jgi:hypothetical protein
MTLEVVMRRTQSSEYNSARVRIAFLEAEVQGFVVIIPRPICSAARTLGEAFASHLHRKAADNCCRRILSACGAKLATRKLSSAVRLLLNSDLDFRIRSRNHGLENFEDSLHLHERYGRHDWTRTSDLYRVKVRLNHQLP